MGSFIHDTSVINNSTYSTVKLFKNARIVDSTLGKDVSVGDDTTIERCVLGNNVAINRRSYINDSEVGDYTYSGINTTMNWTKIGKFCSLARNVDIGGFDHDYHKMTTMPKFRFMQMKSGGGKLEKKVEHTDYCVIGNDVWIAAGAQILHNVKIGDGAVIGAGAVVTHDVPPYAVVVGVPARLIRFRCSEKQIEELEMIRWWDWPEDIIVANMDFLTESDISDETIAQMKKIAAEISK